MKSTKSKNLIRVEQVCKTYPQPEKGELRVLQDLDFTIDMGEFVAIIGPSGSGKTTLLALLGALDFPTSGEIWVADQPVHRLRGTAAADFRRNQVGFVFQMYHLLPELTALENVMLPLLPYRHQLKFDLKQRARDLLEQVGLKQRMGHSPGRLSGGEQQRVAIARALVNHPSVVLADEPTGNLDPATGAEVLDVLYRLQRAGQQTLVMVTHDQAIAAVAGHCIRLDRGEQESIHMVPEASLPSEQQ